MPELLKAIGLMSGTSMDGIDVALIESDGETIKSFGPTLFVEYSHARKQRIEAALEDGEQVVERADRPGDWEALERDITSWHAEAVELFLKHGNVTKAEIDLIGFHGQTMLHRPDDALTVQLGDGQALADATGIDVVYDMRAKDMTVGGQGAPLVPAFHAALARQFDRSDDSVWPVAFVNIGGISNATYVDRDGTIAAFDCGPGNALIDQWVQMEAAIPYDQGGRIALEGGINAKIVNRYMASPFFARRGPKSLDRNDFPPLKSGEAELSDGARSLARVTAQAIVESGKLMPSVPRRWVVCGGGRKNSIIVDDMIALSAPGTIVEVAEAVGLDGDMMEAQAFAFLAICSRANLPLTYPTTTGCTQPVSGGVFAAASTSN
ncbi:MAG: anhydro-N-acetylmuramic acid kinase [Pseudomonadota bacterium]